MDTDLLLKTLFLYGEPEPEAVTYLAHAIKEQELKPNKLLLSEGFANRRLYFLAEGLVREYKNTPEGERTTGFATRGDFFTDFKSFIKQQVSRVSICTETESVVLSLDHPEYRHLITTWPAIKKTFAGFYQHYTERRNRINNSLLDDPLEIQIQTLRSEQPKVFMYGRTKHLVSFFRTNYRTYQKALRKI